MFEKENYLNESDEAYLKDLMMINSDNGFYYFLAKNFNLNSDVIKSFESFQEFDPIFYSKILHGEFKEQYSKRIKTYYIDGIYQYFQSINFNKEELELFRVWFVSYKKRVINNNFKNEITFSEEYIDLIIENLNQLFRDLSGKVGNQSINKMKNRVNSYFILNTNVKVNFKDLRNSLVGKGCLESQLKYSSLKNIFKKEFSTDINKTQINWIGGKDRLGYFVKLLKDKKVVKDGFVYKIASEVFLLDGKQLENLKSPKVKDSLKYSDSFDKILKSHFTIPNNS